MKLKKKLLCLILCAVMAVIGIVILASCEEECDHSLCTEWTVTKPSTCNDYGIKERTCEDCGERFTESLAKKSHKYSDAVYDNNVSCTSPGTKSSTCENCGDVKKEVNPGNPYGHTYFDGVCSACGDTVDLIATYNASRTENDNVTVKVYKQASGQLILDVTGRGEMADYTADSVAPWSAYATNIKTVHFYEGVTRIGDYAFNKLYSLSSVMLEKGLASIGKEAFDNSFSADITYVFDIPTWVSVNFEDNDIPELYMTTLIYVGEVVTDASGNKSVKNPSTTIDNLVIPDTVTKINAYSFYNCAHMNTATIPSSVREIGNYAFYGCSRLDEVYLEDLNAWCTVKLGDAYANPISIAHDLFVGGNLVQSLTISGVTEIAPYVFEKCTSIVSVTLSGVDKVSTRAFSGCTSIAKLNLGDVKEIESYAFYGATALTDLIIPSSIKSLESGVFKNCSKLIRVDLGDGVESISDSAFAGCRSILHLALGTSINNIDPEAFTGCYKIVEVQNRSDIDVSTMHAFGSVLHVYTSGSSKLSYIAEEGDGNGLILYTDENIKSIVGYNGKNESLVLTTSAIGGSYTIGAYAFYNNEIRNITVKDGLIASYNNAFLGTSLKTIRLYDLAAWCGTHFDSETSNPLYYADELYVQDSEEAAIELSIPDGITTVGSYAFAGCGSVTKIAIPASVSVIGKGAFLDCTKALSKVSGVFYIGNWVVDYDKTVSTITINTSTVGIASGVFDGANIKELIAPIDLASHLPKENITVLTVTAGDIPANAFTAYTSLERLSIASGVSSVDPMAFTGLTASNVSLAYDYIGYLDPTRITALTVISGNILASGVAPFTVLKSVTVGSSVTSIEAGAFANNFSIEAVTINAPIAIPADAFSGCYSVKAISLASSVKSIGKDAFRGCDLAKTEKDGVVVIGSWIVGISTDKNYVIINTDIVGIQDGVFVTDSGITRVFYKGKSAAWKKIALNSGLNPGLKTGIVYYYNETKPSSAGNFWHYSSGLPEVWVV